MIDLDKNTILDDAEKLILEKLDTNLNINYKLEIIEDLLKTKPRKKFHEKLLDEAHAIMTESSNSSVVSLSAATIIIKYKESYTSSLSDFDIDDYE